MHGALNPFSLITVTVDIDCFPFSVLHSSLVFTFVFVLCSLGGSQNDGTILEHTNLSCLRIGTVEFASAGVPVLYVHLPFVQLDDIRVNGSVGVLTNPSLAHSCSVSFDEVSSELAGI